MSASAEGRALTAAVPPERWQEFGRFAREALGCVYFSFVSAVDFGIADYPSDDPRTPILNDPTRDVVGNVPLLFATKQAELAVDNGSPGIVDPGDTLRYTITIYNNGTIPATNVVLADNVPPNTTYVADTTTLNGLPYGQPDNGSSPLAAGRDSSSATMRAFSPAAA